MAHKARGVLVLNFPWGVWEEMQAAGWSTAECIVGLWLLTCPERFGVGREGLMPMSAARIAELNPAWSVERVERALAGLERRAWLFRADGWVFVPSVLDYDGPVTPQQARGAVKRLVGAPRHSVLWLAFIDAVQDRAPALYEALQADAASRPLSSASLRVLAAACPPTGGTGGTTGGTTRGGTVPRILGPSPTPLVPRPEVPGVLPPVGPGVEGTPGGAGTPDTTDQPGGGVE